MTENKEVTVAEAKEIATQDNHFDDGLGALDQGDLIIPRLNIVQKTTPDADPESIGKLAINITGDATEEMKVVLIKFSKSRVLFPEKYSKDNEPLCRSHDFLFPANDIEGAEPMNDNCQLIPGDKKKRACEYANWGAKNEPPRCQEVWNMLIVDLENYMPMWLSLKSTALAPIRKMVSSISMISRAKRIPMWGMKFDIKVKFNESDSGDYYTPIFSGLSLLDADDAENMGLIRGELVDVDIKDLVEPEQAQEAAEEEAF